MGGDLPENSGVRNQLGHPEAELRWDTAWQLFLPAHLGDIPSGYPEMLLGRLTAWAWDSAGVELGEERKVMEQMAWMYMRTAVHAPSPKQCPGSARVSTEA